VVAKTVALVSIRTSAAGECEHKPRPPIAGLDVHKQTVVACVRVTTAGRAQHEVRTFATTATGLRALQEWLVAAGCTHAVLESTGVYWKTVWHMLEDSLTLVLANATAVRNLPGRKSWKCSDLT
jgi:transposase